MDRNFFRRIEVAFPVLDKSLRQRVIDEGLRPYLDDNTHAWILHRDGTYRRLTPGRRAPRSAQQWLMNKLVP
jgi:polyphosphate kinase